MKLYTFLRGQIYMEYIEIVKFFVKKFQIKVSPGGEEYCNIPSIILLTKDYISNLYPCYPEESHFFR